MGIKVTPKQNENIQVTLRKFRKLCEKEGLLKELKKHAYYEKPSEKRQREKRKAQRRYRQSLISKQKDRKKKRQYKETSHHENSHTHSAIDFF